MCQIEPDLRNSSTLHDKRTEKNDENKSQGNFPIPCFQKS